MAYEFKKLGEVEALDEVPEGANALIEVDGAIKRVPGSGLGGGCTDFWCGEWDDTANGYWIMATEDAEEPIAYAEFSEALERGAVRLLYRVSDDEGDWLVRDNCPTLYANAETQMFWHNYWDCYLLFIDTVMSTSTASLTETDDDTATTTQRAKWPPRG